MFYFWLPLFRDVTRRRLVLDDVSTPPISHLPRVNVFQPPALALSCVVTSILPPVDGRSRQESVFSYGQHDPGFESRKGKITHLRKVHPGPGVDPASREMRTEEEGLSPLPLKRTGREADHLHIIDIDIFVNCNWNDTRWQQYSTHLHTNSTQNKIIYLLGRVQTMPCLCELHSGICLTTSGVPRGGSTPPPRNSLGPPKIVPKSTRL